MSHSLVTTAGAQGQLVSTDRALAQAVQDRSSVTAEHNAAAVELAAAEAELELLNQVKAARASFAEAALRFGEILVEVEGKVDADAHLERATALQTDALSNISDPPAIEALSESMRAESDDLLRLLAQHDAAEQARRSPSQHRDSSTPSRTAPPPAQDAPATGDALSRARPKLDALGGSWVELRTFDGSCGGRRSQACATPGVISLRPDTIGLSDRIFDWIVVHEYAHMIQFKNWNEITGHEKYQRLFGGDIEWLANCMASAWGQHAHHRTCSAEMLDESHAIWNTGVFRP